ncbi:hypothetical protein LCGC14_2508700, partial [marine sediment metagenome]
YEAYPQLRAVPVHFDYVRLADDVDGKAAYRISSKRQRSATGMTEQTKAGPEITVFRGAEDLGRQTILHEVQHVVQSIEGFAGGSSSKVFRQRIADAAEAHADAIITKDIASGKIDLDSFLKDPTYFSYLGELSDTTGVEVGKLEKAIGDWLRPGVDIDEALWQAEAFASSTRRDLRLMIEEVSKGLPEADQLKLAEQLAEGLSYSQARELAFTRYSRQAGEVEARLTEILKDFSQEKLSKMAGPTVLADTPIEQVIP